MLDLLLRLLGVNVEEARHITGVRAGLHGSLSLGWYILIGILLAIAVYWMYRRSSEDLRTLRRIFLSALRWLFLMLILGLLLRPVLSFTVEGTIRRTLLILIDGSGSMKIQDPRHDPADIKRVAVARGLIEPDKGLDQPLDAAAATGLSGVARVDVMKAALQNPRLDLLSRLAKDYDLALYVFDRTAAEVDVGSAGRLKNDNDSDEVRRRGEYWKTLPWFSRLSAEGAATAIGDSIRKVIEQKRGQPLAGMVLITDGASNSGSQPLDAAAEARQNALPLYVWGVGITAPRDVIVPNVFSPEVAFLDDEVPVTVRVRSQNMAGQEGKLILKLQGPSGSQQVDERSIAWGADGEQVISVRFTPKTVGEFELTAEVPPRDDEVVKTNNSASQHLRVIDGKIKVLLVDEQPRWEFQYLQAALLRDRRVQLKCVLYEADPAIAQAKDSPYLAKFPEKEEDLFKYDLVILGDVDPKALSAGQIEWLGKFVSEFGGSLVFQAGKRHNPHAYRRTLLEKMLPVELEATDADSGRTIADKPVRLKMTAVGRSSLMLRLSDQEQESGMLWSQLPPVYWTARVARAKPAAEVLITDPDESRKWRNQEMPVMAIQQYGVGQVLYMGTDNTWRWRKNVGDKHYAALWGQITYRLALPHLLGGSKTTQLSMDRQSYSTGQRVTIYARLYSKSFAPLTDKQVQGKYVQAGRDGAATAPEVTLRPLPDQPGMYRGEFIAPAPGAFQFMIAGREQEAKLDFTVTEPRQELADTAMNESMLRQLAESSGGAFFREEDLFKLPEMLGQKTERVQSGFEVELWSSPLYFIAMMLFVTLEWVGRKLSQLK